MLAGRMRERYASHMILKPFPASFRLLALTLMFGVGLPGIAMAQGTTPPTANAEVESGGPADSPEEETQTAPRVIAPYDPELMRLAEVLGALHFLRRLCGADEGTVWRDKMQEIVEGEQPDPERKAQMISRFNRGYVGFERSYRSCTPSAIVAIDRYMKEGVRLTSRITTRFGN
jgi:uncharacterized protein (TIGR02301 family)